MQGSEDRPYADLAYWVRRLSAKPEELSKCLDHWDSLARWFVYGERNLFTGGNHPKCFYLKDADHGYVEQMVSDLTDTTNLLVAWCDYYPKIKADPKPIRELCAAIFSFFWPDDDLRILVGAKPSKKALIGAFTSAEEVLGRLRLAQAVRMKRAVPLPRGPEALPRLTKTERAIAEFIWKNPYRYTWGEVARETGINPSTVETYLMKIDGRLRQLGFNQGGKRKDRWGPPPEWPKAEN